MIQSRSSLLSALRWMALAIELTIALLSGCTQSHDPELPPLHPVSGVVKYRGQPAAGMRVVFHPLGEIGAVKFAPAAVTDATGSFQLRSYRPADGAPVGDYAVTFTWPERLVQETDPEPIPEVDRLRGMYGSPDPERFHVQVQPGTNAIPPFELR